MGMPNGTQMTLFQVLAVIDNSPGSKRLVNPVLLDVARGSHRLIHNIITKDKS